MLGKLYYAGNARNLSSIPSPHSDTTSTSRAQKKGIIKYGCHSDYEKLAKTHGPGTKGIVLGYQVQVEMEKKNQF